MKRTAQCFATVAFGNDGYGCLGEARNEAVIGTGINMKFKRYTGANQTLQIRMVAGYRELVHRKQQLIAEACNHLNCLVLPFSVELIRLAA